MTDREQTSDARSVRGARRRHAIAAARRSGAAVLLARKRQTREPIVYHAPGTQLKVYVVAEDGIATIGGSDMLIWAASHRLAAQDYRPPTSRSIRFTPYKLLVAIGRTAGDREYHLLKDALTRLQSTLIRITIRYGAQRRRQQFSWINEWEELTTRSGRCQGIEFVVPAWFYQGVLDRVLVPVSRGGKRRSGTAHRQEREP